MDIQKTVAKRLVSLCNQYYISMNQLATKSGVPPSTVKNIIYGKSKNPGIATIKMLCDGFGITLGEFFSTPEFDDLAQEIK